jgi:hypothetical protein
MTPQFGEDTIGALITVRVSINISCKFVSGSCLVSDLQGFRLKEVR